MIRCEWVSADPLMIEYHDREWGVPIHDDLRLFEFLILEGAQAGLSWSTILKKRENYQRAFDGFDPEKVAEYSEEKIETLLNDSGIIRNRRKVEAAVANAKAFLEIQKEFGSFDEYIWSFVGGKAIQNRWDKLDDMPSKTNESFRMSEDLKRRGFKFVGPTICYAFMQAVGMANDHTTDCFRHAELEDVKGSG